MASLREVALTANGAMKQHTLTVWHYEGQRNEVVYGGVCSSDSNIRERPNVVKMSWQFSHAVGQTMMVKIAADHHLVPKVGLEPTPGVSRTGF